MLFVIDVGNSNIVLGIYIKERLMHNWRIRTIHNITEDEFNLLIKALFLDVKIYYSDISLVTISSVVPSLKLTLSSFCKKYLGCTPYWIDTSICNYMPILIDNPDELGADRIVNAVSAYSKYKRSLIIVDFGTATTFDVVSEKGEYLGGAIAPGIAIASEALFKKASKLSRIDVFSPPTFAIGKNTTMSMQSGIVFGYAALVDGLVKRLTSEMKEEPLVIATGGLAQLMANISQTIQRVNLLLTLEGLHIISKKIYG